MMSSSKSKKLKKLPTNLQSVVRSGIAIQCVSQCVEELVFNAIDAEAKTILIGVNIDQLNVRAEDDGYGINEADLAAAGERYTTSKCNCLDDLTRLKYYGFRGEALASIINVSSTVDIITRPKDTAGIELKKKFEDGQEAGFVEKYNTKNKKPGTAIIIGRLLSMYPVRQNRIDKSIQLEEVKNCLERIALINPTLNIELRNEKNGTQLFDYKTSSSYSEAFDKLFQNRLGFEVNFIEEHFLYRSLFFHISVSKKYFKTKHHQFVYVNNRYIQRNRIYRWVGRGILTDLGDQGHYSSSPKGDKYPIFILNITCPLKDYDVTLEPKKQIIEFKVWEDVQKGIEGLLSKLKMTNNLGVPASKHNTSEIKSASFITSYNVKGAIHSRFAVRPDEKMDSRIKETYSDRGSSAGRSSTSGGMSSKRSLTRSGGQNTHVVDVRAIRRKRKLETSNLSNMEPPQQFYSIGNGNKPLLTMGIFDRFKEWKGELKKSENPPHSKRRKEHQPESRIENQTTTVPPAAVTTENNRNFDRPASSSADSVLNWKMDRFINGLSINQTVAESMDLAVGDEVPLNQNQVNSLRKPSGSIVNSLDGFSDTISAFDNNNNNKGANQQVSNCKSWQTQILSSTEQYLQGLVEQKWKMPNTRNSVLQKIIQYWQLATKKDSKKVPKISKQIPEKQQQRVSLGKVEQSVAKCLETSSSYQTECQILETSSSDRFLTNKKGEAKLQGSEQKTNLMESELSFRQSLPDHFKVPFPTNGTAPPLLNLFPYQKSCTAEWNDMMMSGDYTDSDSDLFPPETDFEIVLDQNEQEWLQTVDERGRKLFINLSDASSSYDMVNVFNRVKVTAVEMKKVNLARYKWLRRHFPRGFQQFVNSGEREVHRQGDFTKIESSTIKETVLQCLQDQDQKPLHSKWNEKEFRNASKYFDGSGSAAFQAVSNNNNSKFSDIQCWKTLTSGTSSFRFAREDFDCVQVNGQYDRKFILAGIGRSRTKNMTLVIFDQHAVHERIRLENLISDSYTGNSKTGKKCLQTTDVMPPYPINLSDSEVRLMKNHAEIFFQAGIKFQPISSVCVKIRAVPKCFFEKSAAESVASRETVFRSLVFNLIKELIQHIMGTKGSNLVVLPKTVHDVLCSQACHGAIKFGDVLDQDRCCQLISDWKKCKSLFQCAHGRPTVVPLIKSEDLMRTSTTNLVFSHTTTTENHNSLSLPVHQDCSDYFCSFLNNDSKQTTSAYFGKPTFPISNFSTTTEKIQKLQSRSAFGFKDDVFNAQPTNLFPSSTDQQNNDDDDDNESPYFFKR